MLMIGLATLHRLFCEDYISMFMPFLCIWNVKTNQQPTVHENVAQYVV